MRAINCTSLILTSVLLYTCLKTLLTENVFQLISALTLTLPYNPNSNTNPNPNPKAQYCNVFELKK